VRSLVERFGGESEADLQSKADVGRAIMYTGCLSWIDSERLGVHLGDDVDDRSRPENHQRVAGERADEHVRVAVVVHVGRTRRQRRAESPQSAADNAGKFPRADALRVRRQNPARRPAKYVNGSAAFVRRADRQV